MTFWRCYYHVVWTTKNRSAWITPDVERVLFASFHAKAKELESPLLAVNGVADHIHIAACIPPKMAVAEWVRHMKGVSAHEVNAMFANLPEHFRWQNHYGVLTFGVTHRDFVIGYIQRQKERHASMNIEPYMERVDEDE